MRGARQYRPCGAVALPFARALWDRTIRTCAAFLATAFRCSGVSFFMRPAALRRPKATAAGFFSLLVINARNNMLNVWETRTGPKFFVGSLWIIGPQLTFCQSADSLFLFCQGDFPPAGDRADGAAR